MNKLERGEMIMDYYNSKYQIRCILCGGVGYSNDIIKQPHICLYCRKGRRKELIEKIIEQYVRNKEKEVK